MTKLALLALLVPLAATADDAPAPGATTTTTTTTPDGTTTTTTTTLAAPGATPPAPIAAPQVDTDPCAYEHGRWRHRMKGRLSIGFSKSHVELADDRGEGKQKSFVVRLNGRRGWSLELELSRLSLDGGESAKTGGVSLVKTFGRRKLAPYVLAGGGGGRYERVDGSEQRLGFGEIGAGVMLRGRRFAIGFDVRRGVRRFEDAEDHAVMTGVERGVATPTDDHDHDHDHYTRGRVLALVTF